MEFRRVCLRSALSRHGGNPSRSRKWRLPYDDGLGLADPRRPVRGRFHLLPPLRRWVQKCALDDWLPRLGGPIDGAAGACLAQYFDGNRLCGLGRHRCGGNRPGRHRLLPGTRRSAPHRLHLRHRRLHRGPEAAPLMAVDEGLCAWVQEALEPLGPVTMRKMMGGATLYLDGTIFAILDEGEIWFKADAETDTIWDAEGCERFSMTFKDGRVYTMN